MEANHTSTGYEWEAVWNFQEHHKVVLQREEEQELVAGSRYPTLQKNGKGNTNLETH